MPNVEIRLDLSALSGIGQAAQDAAWETAMGLHNQIETAQVVPMDYGKLQESMGAVDQFQEGEEIHTTLNLGDTSYARRLYFHPEYNFQTVNNPNAQGQWAEHWLEGGSQANYAPDTFRARMGEKLR